MDWVGTGLGVAAAVAALRRVGRAWRATRHLFGPGLVRLMGVVVRLTWTPRHYALLGVTLAVEAGLLTGVCRGMPGLLGVGLGVGAVAADVAIRSALPPTALVLTGSSTNGGELLVGVARRLQPLRAVALLDPARLSGHHLVWLLWSNVRTSNDEVWKSLIHRLVQLARIVVVDAREERPALTYEADLMLSPMRVHKATFVCNDDLQCPVLDSLNIDPHEHGVTVRTVEGQWRHLADLATLGDFQPYLGDGAEVAHLVRENWDTLPSACFIGLVREFDTAHVLRLASRTDKDLVVLLMPPGEHTIESAQRTIEWTQEFSRDPHIVGVMFLRSAVAVFHRSFLLGAGPQVPHRRAIEPVPPFTMDVLNAPPPVLDAAHRFCHDLHRIATQRGMEIRFVEL